TRNGGLLLDQYALDGELADAHPENLAGCLLRLVGSGGELDSAGLAALARRSLRLDDAGPDIGGRHGRFRRTDTERAARHRNAGRRQNQRFCSVFLEIHSAAHGLVTVMAGLVPVTAKQVSLAVLLPIGA